MSRRPDHNSQGLTFIGFCLVVAIIVYLLATTDLGQPANAVDPAPALPDNMTAGLERAVDEAEAAPEYELIEQETTEPVQTQPVPCAGYWLRRQPIDGTRGAAFTIYISPYADEQGVRTAYFHPLGKKAVEGTYFKAPSVNNEITLDFGDERLKLDCGDEESGEAELTFMSTEPDQENEVLQLVRATGDISTLPPTELGSLE